MQFDFFDKKIKEAAENHHPAYDEKAWTKMGKLLDKHLPQKKDGRRRIIFFLLLFFLLVGGGISYILIGKPWKNNKPLSRIESKTEQSVPVMPNEKKSSDYQPGSNVVNEANKQNIEKKEENNLSQSNTSQPKLSEAGQQKINSRIKDAQTRPLITKNNQSEQTPTSNLIITPTDIKKDNDIVTVPANNNQQPIVVDNNIKKADVAALENTDKNVVNNNVADNKKNELVKNDQSEKKKTAKNRKGGFFSFTVSAGPDVSKAGSSDLSKLTLSYGAGISYTLKKFTLRSGFYVDQKIYSANPGDYKLAYTLPAYIKLLNVDADCKIYEIPLGLTYNFSDRKNSNWYAGIGLSSYLMKKEKYKNAYKNTNSGQTYYRSFQYNNENKHYFSVLDLSAGYTYRLNNTISFSAEPYVKIPLQGVGEGKVKLNSAGVLFSVGIKPFKSAKNK